MKRFPLHGLPRATTLVMTGLVVTSLNAWAGRPFTTEDAGVLDKGACEWETTRSRLKSAATATLIYAQAGCGWAEGVQVNLGTGRSREGAAREDVPMLSGKWRLQDGGEDGTSWILAGSASGRRPAGASLRLSTIALNLVASRPLAAGWTGHANLGTVREHDGGRSRGTWALAAERPIAEGLDLGVEVYQEGQGRPWQALGVRWLVAPGWTLYGSAGQRSSSTAGTERLQTLGFKLDF